MRALISICMLAAPSALYAGEDYQSSLKKGDQFSRSGNYDSALSEFTTAVSQAANNTQKALALSKQSYVLTFKKKDYDAGKKKAEEALALEDVKPIGKVTALHSLAQCQMKKEKNHDAAEKNLKKALAFEGVDWAKPSLKMSLGDCYRFSWQNKSALETYQSIIDMADVPNGTKAVAHLNKGLIHQYALRENDKAKACYASAVKLNAGLKSEVDNHLKKMTP